jgi:hypothetical protein
MAASITLGATTLQLPPDITWPDEFDWTATQATRRYSMGGALLVNLGTKLAGRPITLASLPQRAWATRAVATTLRTWSDTPGAQMTLALRGATYAVMFSPDGTPVQSTPVFEYPDPLPQDFVRLTLRLITTG